MKYLYQTVTVTTKTNNAWEIEAAIDDAIFSVGPELVATIDEDDLDTLEYYRARERHWTDWNGDGYVTTIYWIDKIL